MSELIASLIYLIILAILDNEITKLTLSRGFVELNQYLSDLIKRRGANVMYLVKLPAIAVFTVLVALLYVVSFQYFWLPYIILGSMYLGAVEVTLLNWLHYKSIQANISRKDSGKALNAKCF